MKIKEKNKRFNYNLFVKNRKGDEKIIAVYWFAILLIVAGALVYMVFIFYGKPYSVRQTESEILTNQIANCLAEGGYLKENIVMGLNSENILERCNLNFNVEDFKNWKEEEQYYIELEIYEFNENLPEGDVGKTLLEINKGNKNLKPSETYEGQYYEKNTIVLHYTAGGGTYEGVENVLKNRRLSIHYIVQKDGKVAECKLNEWKLEECILRDDVSEIIGTWENTPAQHSGCGDEPKLCPSECITNAGLLNKSCYCFEGCCIPGFNQKAIGIEIINYGCACGGSAKESCQYLGEGIQLESRCSGEANCYGLSLWEEYTDEQMESLIKLVAGITERQNIPIDVEHIIGHEDITNTKWDLGPAFNWTRLIEGVKELRQQEISEEPTSQTLILGTGRNFYVIDENNNKYIIKILGVVGKDEKNE